MGILITIGSSTMNGVADRKGGVGARSRARTNSEYEDCLTDERHGVWEYATTGERITTTSEKVVKLASDHRLRGTKILFIGGLGMYDACRRQNKTKNQVSLSEFEAHVGVICDTINGLKQDRPDMVEAHFYGMTPLGGSEVSLGREGRQDIFTENQRQLYENSCRGMVTHARLGFTSLYDLCGGKTGYKEGYVSRDRVHPGPKAYDVMERITWQLMKSCLDESVESIPASISEQATVLAAPAAATHESNGVVIMPTQQTIADLHRNKAAQENF